MKDAWARAHAAAEEAKRRHLEAGGKAEAAGRRRQQAAAELEGLNAARSGRVLSHAETERLRQVREELRRAEAESKQRVQAALDLQAVATQAVAEERRLAAANQGDQVALSQRIAAASAAIGTATGVTIPLAWSKVDAMPNIIPGIYVALLGANALAVISLVFYQALAWPRHSPMRPNLLPKGVMWPGLLVQLACMVGAWGIAIAAAF